MSRSAVKLEKVRADRDRLFAEGKYYEALQLYKTMYSRAGVRKAWAEARAIVMEGALALLQQQQANAGGELALALIDLFNKSKQTCDKEAAADVLSLSSAFPSNGHEAKINFLKAAIKWSTPPTGLQSGYPDFHLALARTHRALGDYAAAHQHYLRSAGAAASSSSADASLAQPEASVVEAGENLLAWAAQGAPSELDLFVARAALQFLCLEDIASATQLLQWAGRQQPKLADEPLIHLAQFVCELAQRSKEAAPLLDLLRHKYALALSRDPALDQYLDRIGELYLGRPAPKDFMQSMLSGLSSSTPAPAKASSPPAASSAPAAAAQMAPAADTAPMVTDVD